MVLKEVEFIETAVCKLHCLLVLSADWYYYQLDNTLSTPHFNKYGPWLESEHKPQIF